MNLSVGIVGLPNVGKSTLFNALVGQELAKVTPHPFTTIKPNIGIISIPDERLDKLTRMVEKTKGTKVQKVPATIKFIDIAGLVKGAAKGAGLGNQFLGHIREVDAICFVLRDFEDARVEKIGTNPQEDFETLKIELILKDLETIEKSKVKSPPASAFGAGRWRAGQKSKVDTKIKNLIEKLIKNFNKGIMARDINLDREERELVKNWFLLTNKPYIIVLNASEDDLATAHHRPRSQASPDHLGRGSLGSILVCAKLELEILELKPQEQKEYLKSLGLEKPASVGLLKTVYKTLDLITFYTVKGAKQVTAWPVREGIKASDASGIIHSDFVKKFIKAEIINWEKLIKAGSWVEAAKLGWLTLHGRDYQVRDGDVVEFKLSG